MNFMNNIMNIFLRKFDSIHIFAGTKNFPSKRLHVRIPYKYAVCSSNGDIEYEDISVSISYSNIMRNRLLIAPDYGLGKCIFIFIFFLSKVQKKKKSCVIYLKTCHGILPNFNT